MIDEHYIDRVRHGLVGSFERQEKNLSPERAQSVS